jgi:hypothetical protein
MMVEGSCINGLPTCAVTVSEKQNNKRAIALTILKLDFISKYF